MCRAGHLGMLLLMSGVPLTSTACTTVRDRVPGGWVASPPALAGKATSVGSLDDGLMVRCVAIFPDAAWVHG